MPEEAGKSRMWKFVEMIAFCFYIPNGIGGPLINYSDYRKGVNIFKNTKCRDMY